MFSKHPSVNNIERLGVDVVLEHASLRLVVQYASAILLLTLRHVH
jgi:hypothetical protein